VTTAVSEVDAEYFRRLTTTPERVRIFINAVDLNTYVGRPARPPDLRQPSLLLAGTFYAPTSPMVRAARWVLDEILPLVHAKIADAHLYIVGNMSDVMMADVRHPHVTVTGKLPSLLPLLRNADVALVPLMFESGTRFKILEAGACALPLVSTTLGAEGIRVTDGHDILIADDGARFAESIVRIIAEPDFAAKLGANLQGLVARDYSVETLSQQAEGILRCLA
jgi:glycosyltransferase involved in cell wall biosynthesis